MSEQLNEGEGQTSQEPSSETAPEQKEKVTFDPDQQAVIDKVALQGRENVRTERQKNADLQRDLDEARAKIPQEVRPSVIEAGDTFEEDYETKQQTREEQIRKQAVFDARGKWDAEAQQADQIATQQKQQQDFNDSVVTFRETASKFDIDQNAVALMDQTIASYGGVTPEVGQFIINDEQGMLIWQHMASNPLDIQTVNNMPLQQQGIFLADIKAKQVALHTKNQSTAPDPAENLTGSGVPPGKRGSKGATYE